MVIKVWIKLMYVLKWDIVFLKDDSLVKFFLFFIFVIIVIEVYIYFSLKKFKIWVIC